MFKETLWRDPKTDNELHFNQKNHSFEFNGSTLYNIDEHDIVGFSDEQDILDSKAQSTLSRKLSTRFSSDTKARSAYLTYLELWPEDIVLEVGVGSGANIKLLPMKSVKFIGLDTSQKELEKCAKTKKDYELSLTLCRANPLSLPFIDNCFDSVFHDDMNQVYPDPIPVIKEMLRVSKQGGKILYTCKDARGIQHAINDDVRGFQVHEIKKSSYVALTFYKK